MQKSDRIGEQADNTEYRQKRQQSKRQLVGPLLRQEGQRGERGNQDDRENEDKAGAAGPLCPVDHYGRLLLVHRAFLIRRRRNEWPDRESGRIKILREGLHR